LAIRAIRCTPGSAARGLIYWALDLWPYINGKAIVSGVRLAELEASEMLDVIHYFFEEDIRNLAKEQIEYNNSIRDSVYENLYDGKYKRVFTKNSGNKSYDFDEELSAEEREAPIKPFNPRTEKTKSYIPPTPILSNPGKPFGATLEEPLN
jgi:hypothetical protein